MSGSWKRGNLLVLFFAVLLVPVATRLVAGRAHNTFSALEQVVIVVALIFTLRRWRSPRVMVCLPVIAGVFNRDVRVPFLTINIGYAALVVAALALTAQRTDPRRLPSNIYLPAASIATGMLLGDITGTAPSAAFTFTVRWIAVVTYLLAMARHFRSDPTVRDVLIKCFLWCSIISGAFGYLQKIGHTFFVGPEYEVNRIDSTFGYYSNFGNFEAIAFVLATGVLLSARQRRRGAAALAAVTWVVSGWCIVENLSRGAVVSAAVGVGFLVLALLVQGRIGAVLRFLGALLALYFILPVDALRELRGRFTIVQGGDQLRFELQAVGRTILNQHPFGIGAGNFRGYVYSGRSDANVPLALAHAHSTFIETGDDGGWLALIGLVALMAVAVLTAMRSMRDRGMSPAVIGAAAVLGVAAAGTNDYFFFEAGSHTVFAVALALALGGSSVAAIGTIDAPPPPSAYDGARRDLARSDVRSTSSSAD